MQEDFTFFIKFNKEGNVQHTETPSAIMMRPGMHYGLSYNQQSGHIQWEFWTKVEDEAKHDFVTFFTERLKFKNSTGSILTMTILVGILIGIISLFVPLIIEQGKNLSLLDVESFQSNLTFLYAELSNYLSGYNIKLDNTIFNIDLLDNIDFTFLPEILNSVGKTLGNLTIGVLSVMFISFFFLKDSKLIQNILIILVPKKSSKKFRKSYNSISKLLSRYFAGLVLQISILFIIYTILLLIIGIPNAIVIAFLCSLLNLIPFIGPFIGGILMILLTMTSHISMDFSSVILPKTIYVFIGFGVGQLIARLLTLI